MTSSDGTAVRTVSRLSDTADVVVRQDQRFRAAWWTRIPVPGGLRGLVDLRQPLG